MGLERMKKQILEIFGKIKTQAKYLSLIGCLVLVCLLAFILVAIPKSGLESRSKEKSLSWTQSVKSDPGEGRSEKNQEVKTIVVDIKGAVKKPDIYKVASDLRVDDVVQLAGGFTDQADQKSINLAAKLKDEEVIYIGTQGEGLPPAGGNPEPLSPTRNSQREEKVNINQADLTELQTLSGIGEKKAQDIINYREQNGPFKSIEDLGQVSGFGEKTIDKLRGFIAVD